MRMMQRKQRLCSEESDVSNIDSSVYYTPKEYPSSVPNCDQVFYSAQPPVRKCSLSKKFSQSRNRYSSKAQTSHTSSQNSSEEPSTSTLKDHEQYKEDVLVRRPSRQYISNRKYSSAKPYLRRNSSLEVLTAQRQLMDRALRELYASMQELRQANDSPRARMVLERSRSLDDSDITDFHPPIKMSTLTPMERVAIKGLASQRRRSLRSKSVTDKRSVYSNLIPDVFTDERGVYKSDTLGVNPWTDETAGSSAYCQEEMDETSDLNMDKTTREKYLRREQIYESLENILNEIETFSDYKVPQVHLKTNLTEGEIGSPRMAMEVPPSAFKSLFKTPRPLKTSWRRKKSADTRKPVAEVSWDPEPEYRSVLTGEVFPPLTPSINVFYGQSVSTTSKVLRTVCLAYTYFVLGMCVSMIGPALLDITEIAHMTSDNAYQFLIIRGAGVAVGCVLLGSLIRRFDHYMTFALVLTACGLANFSFPVLHSYVGMVLLEMLMGVCLGFLEAGVQIVCIDIWQEKNGLYMLAVHFVYGLGTIIGPLIAQPFLGDSDAAASQNTSITFLQHPVVSAPDPSFYDNITASTENVYWPEHRFQYAYFIVGGLFLSCAMCQVFIWLWGGECSCRYKSTQMDDMSTLTPDITNQQPTLLVLTALFMFIHVGIEFAYRGLLASYVVKSLGWSRSVGAWMTSLTFSTYTLGRGLGFGFSKCLDSGVLLWFNLILILVALLLELLLVDHYPATIWITTSIQGLGQSTVLPSCFLWASNKLQVQGITAGILLFIASLGLMVLPGVTGTLMASFKLAAFQIVPLTGVLLNVVIFLAMFIMGKKTEDILSVGPIPKATHFSSTPKTRTTYVEDEPLDENSNVYFQSVSNQQQASSAVRASAKLKHPTLSSLQIHPEFTGSPQCYRVHNDKFTPPTVPEIQVTSATTVHTKLQSPSTMLQTPYSMNSFTPLAVMSYLHPNSAR